MAVDGLGSPLSSILTDASGDSPYVAQVRRHNRSFGSHQVLRDIDLDIEPGEFVALLGRSGCGKSTLLRSLARLDPTPAGEVTVHGRTSVAFQETRLLPWKRVRQNVALALLQSPESKPGLLDLSQPGCRRLIDEVGVGRAEQRLGRRLGGTSEVAAVYQRQQCKRKRQLHGP